MLSENTQELLVSDASKVAVNPVIFAVASSPPATISRPGRY